MRIFDNVLLKQYLDVGAELKVYANQDWYSIADKSDVADPVDGMGQDEYGATHRFSYQSIQQIQVNGETITLEMLATKFGDKGAGEEDDSKGSSKPSGGGDDGPEEEPDKEDKGKGPDLSWFSPAYDIGRILMKEKEERNRKLGNKI